MNFIKLVNTTIFVICTGLLISCGGGGGSTGGGGIGGTGAAARGEIDGFGSIFVNGIKYDTSSATVLVNNANSTEGDLDLGMIVTVEGNINSDNVTGMANRVIFESELQGPVASLALSDDEDKLILDVLGVTVIADSGNTVFAGVAFDSLSINDLIEISGHYNEDDVLIASRIKRVEVFVPGTSQVVAQGTVSNLLVTTFELGSLIIDFSVADLSDVSDSTLVEGMAVKVKGTLDGNTITASRIKERRNAFDDINTDDVKISLEGIIANYVNDSDFSLNGIQVNAESAEFDPVSLVLVDGLKVEVEGFLVEGVLVADVVRLDDAGLKLEATVENINTEDNEITLIFATGDSVVVHLDNRSKLIDRTKVEKVLLLDEINVNDFVQIKARLDMNENDETEIVAKQIKRFEPMDDDPDTRPNREIVQGPVDGFVKDDPVDPDSITVLGVTYIINADPDGTDFEGIDDNSLDVDEFFDNLNEGAFLQIKDNEVADGIADEVEYEN
jgi:hypothetical protein